MDNRVAVFALIALAPLFANTTSGSHRTARNGTYCASCKRNAKGKEVRSATAKHEFERQNPCPSTGKTTGACPGYVVDHVKPLACGGADAPSNMQWQTTAEGKAKDKTERVGCR